LLATTLNQENPDRNHKLWNTGSIEIYMYTPYACVAGMLRHVNGHFTMEKFKPSI
jgi:hypothetical protein